MDEAQLRRLVEPIAAAGQPEVVLALCPDQPDELSYLTTFEAAMQRLLDARRAQPDAALGLGVAFASAAQGRPLSYRRALKKYSRSIVFEDVGIHLFLALKEGEVIALSPSEVNPFLVELNRWIAARPAGSGSS